jgi:hypothetical protein
MEARNRARYGTSVVVSPATVGAGGGGEAAGRPEPTLVEAALPVGAGGLEAALDRQVVPEAREEVAEAVRLKHDERVAVAAALRAAGMKVAQIARALGVRDETVRRYLEAAREWGALRDVLRDIDCRLLPAAVENLEHFLREKDKQVTLELLKGRGVLTRPGAREGTSGPTTFALQVNVVQAPPPEQQVQHALDRAALPEESGELVGRSNDAAAPRQ